MVHRELATPVVVEGPVDEDAAARVGVSRLEIDEVLKAVGGT